MTSAAEDNGLLGDEQFGFRKGRSTIDAAFVLTTIVWRAGLWAKLTTMGFGGKTLRLIQSMYKNDSISFFINGQYSPKLWLSQGVKQGTESED